MKKLLRFSDIIILLSSVLGLILQVWIRLTGTDDRGLYDPRHPGWIFTWVLSIAVLVFVWALSRKAGNRRSYKANFPASPIGAFGSLVAAAALVYAGYTRLQGSAMWLDTLAGFVALTGSIGLLIAADHRLRGTTPPFFCYMLPCAFFSLQIFFQGWKMGGQPEAIRYLFPALATLALIPASYHLWGFCVGAGERKNSLFWSLLSGFLCITAAPAEDGGPVYLALGFWILSNLCVLKYLPRPSRPAPQPEQEELPSDPEVPITMEEAFFPAEPEQAPAESDPVQPASADEISADDIITEILREIDSNIE